MASTPSSYIPTSGSTATRAAETLSIPAAKLPYPEPVVIGPELVTNGGFDSDITGWNFDSSAWEWSDGKARHAPLDATDYSLIQIIDTGAEGAIYRVKFDYTNENGEFFSGNHIVASATRRVWSSASGSASYITSAGEGVIGFLRKFNSAGADPVIFTIDNVSVREIQPLAVSIAMEGESDYSDEGTAAQLTLARWQADANNYISIDVDTDGADTGEVNFNQADGGTVDTVAVDGMSPGLNQSFSVAGRFTSTAINGAVGGTAGTEDTTPTALPSLSTTDLDLAPGLMGTLKLVRLWGQGVGNDGIEDASS